MSSEHSLPRWRQTPSELPFTAQDHSRVSSLNINHKMRPISRPNGEERSQDDWHRPRLTPTPPAPLSPVFLTDKQYFEREAFLTAPHPSKQDFERETLFANFQAPKQGFERERASPAYQAVNQGFQQQADSHAFKVKKYRFENASAAPDYSIYNQEIKQEPFPASFQGAPAWNAYDPAAQLTAKQKLDHKYFVSNTPTLHLGFTSTARAAPAWHEFTTLETDHHSVTKLFTAELAAAKLQTAHHSLAKLITGQHTVATLKRVRYKNVSLVGMGLAALILVVLFAQSSLTHQTLSTLKTTSATSASQLASNLNNATQQATPTSTPSTSSSAVAAGNETQTSSINASKALVRLSQLDPNEYASQSEANTWAYSTCSTTALAEVFNAYGRHYRVTDVLKVESAIGEITPQMGLLENIGIARTATKFGFTTNWGNNWTLDQVLNNANAGRPVIVGWPPYKYTDGHIVVVTGGDANHVYLADSSVWNRHVISRSQFMQWWAGFAAVVTPA